MKKSITMFVAMVMLVCTGIAQPVKGSLNTPKLRACSDQVSAVQSRKVMSNGLKVSGNPAWGQTMSYCLNEPFASNIGAGGSVYWGIKIEAAALVGRNNITDVEFYVANDGAGSYDLTVYSGGDSVPGTPLATQTVTATTADEGAWKTIHFTTPVAITQGQNLWVTFYNSGVAYPAAGVTGNAYDNGKWVSTNGTNWYLLNEISSLDYTWMIRVLTDTYPVTAPEVAISGPDLTFTGDTTVFTAVSANATSYTWNITADYVLPVGDQAKVVWYSTGNKTVTVVGGNTAGYDTASMTIPVYTPSVVNLTNNGDGYMYVYNYSTENNHRIHTPEAVHGLSGDTLVVQTATFMPTSSYYGTMCDSSNARLTSLTVDGVNIPLDGSDSTLVIHDYTSNGGYTIYNYPVVFGSQPHTVVATYGPYYDSTVVMHDLTVVNTGGGYVYTYENQNFVSYTGTTVVTRPSTDVLDFGAGTIGPQSPYYGQLGVPDSATQLKFIYLDGVSQPLDGSGSVIVTYDQWATNGFVWYDLEVDFTTNHTLQFVFGPFDTVIVPVDTTLRTITVTNNGGGWLYGFYNGSNGVECPAGNSQFTGSDGDLLYLRASTDSPMSDYYDVDAPASAAQLNAIYLDGVSVPIDGSDSSVVVYDEMAESGYTLYQMVVPFDANHQVEFVFGPYTGSTMLVDIVGTTSVMVGSAASFVATCTDSTATFAWTVDGVSAGTGSTLNYTFSTTGMHTVSVTATTAAGSVTKTISVNVYSANQHTITITHNGGYVLTSESDGYSIESPTTYTGEPSDTLVIVPISFYNASFAAQVGLPDAVRLVKHVYVDGTEVPLNTLQTYYDSEYDYMEYFLVMTYDADQVVNIVFGDEGSVDNFTVTATSNDETRGVTLGSGTYAMGETATLMALCQMGMQFAGWSDGSTDNPLTITVTSDVNITAYYVPGSGGVVYIHDTIYVGMEKVDVMDVKIYGYEGRVYVEGAEGYDVVFYDAVGRTLATKHDDFGPVYFDVPASGAYLVRVGEHSARRIVVTK